MQCNNGSRNGGPRFRWAGPMHTEANSHYELHHHPWNELVLVQQGRYRSSVSGKEYIAAAGDVLLYTTGTPHEEWTEDGMPVLTWACAFEWDGFGPQEPVYRRDTCGKIQDLLSTLTAIYLGIRLHGWPQGQMEQCATILDNLLAELKKLEAHGPYAMVEQARALIRSRMAETFTVEELAAGVGLSRSHFTREYSALTGRTPAEDITRMRVEEAHRLILTTSLPLKAIAPQVGIATEYHLSRLLKSILGVGVRDLRGGK